jgi:WD40 repeat protein
MQLVCPFCGYRTEREVCVGEVISCPVCERPYQPLSGLDEQGKPLISATLVLSNLSFSPPPTRAKPRWSKASTLFMLFWLGLILFLPGWSSCQNARNRVNSPPGKILSTDGYVLKVVFRPDGQRLASGGGIYKGRGKWVTGEVKVWDPTTGQPVLAFAGHPEGVTGLDFSPDGKRLATASSDGVKVWDAATGKQLLSLRILPNEKPWRVVFDPQGERLATLSETGRKSVALRVWHALPTEEGQKTAPMFSYPFQASASGPGLWNLPGLVFSPDGVRLACGRDNTVLIWNLSPHCPGDKTAPAVVLEGHTRPVRDQAFSPDGKRLATASDDETVRIWDPATGQELLCFDSPRDGIPGYRGIGCLAFSPDGKRLAGGKAQNLVIWDAATGKELHYLRWHSGTIESLAFSPDGKTLATGADDHEIKLWDLTALEHWHEAGQGAK